jgi:hypothetical protein
MEKKKAMKKKRDEMNHTGNKMVVGWMKSSDSFFFF